MTVDPDDLAIIADHYGTEPARVAVFSVPLHTRPRPCFQCGSTATSFAWLDSTYYFACFMHATRRPESIPASTLQEALARLHGGSP